MISLRKAKIDDHWRKVYKRRYPLLITELTFSEGAVFGDIQLSLEAGMNTIVGKNGIGKSNFIRAIYNSLVSEGSNRKRFPRLLDTSRIKLDMTLGDDEFSLDLSPSEHNEIEQDILCLLFDPCTLIPEIQKLFQDQDNLAELLESFSIVPLSSDQLKVVNFVTNTEYSSIEVVNIEDEYESFPMLPFFIVDRQGVKYDSRDMGLGELSLLYYCWIIDYIKKTESNCFLIIEEPESFIPPLNQNRLCDVLAMTLATKGASCLVSTHSEHVLRRIPRSHVHIMSRVDNHIRFFNAASNFEQMGVLGLTAPKIGVLFYEDHAAYLFTKALVRASPLFVIDSFHYHKSGSDSEVISDLRRFPSSLSDFLFIAVFDGDCRGRLDDQLKSFNNFIFLPSSSSPEEHLIAYLRVLDLSVVASYIGRPSEILNAAIDVAAGLDHHDYFIELAKIVGLSYDDLFTKLCELWISDEANGESVMAFFTELEAKAM